MRILETILAYFGIIAGRFAMHVNRHPKILLFLVAAALGGVIAWVIVTISLLVNLMRALFVLLYVALVPTAVFSVERDRRLSRRLWINMLASVLGLLSMRVVYHDLLGLQLDPTFRPNLIGIFGLICGVTGFLRIR